MNPSISICEVCKSVFFYWPTVCTTESVHCRKAQHSPDHILLMSGESINIPSSKYCALSVETVSQNLKVYVYGKVTSNSRSEHSTIEPLRWITLCWQDGLNTEVYPHKWLHLLSTSNKRYIYLRNSRFYNLSRLYTE